MIELTNEQGRAIGEAVGPVLVVDPATKREFVLIRADVFLRQESADPGEEPSTQELQRRLFNAGVLSEIKPPITDISAYENLQTVVAKGESISQAIIRERR